MSFETQKIKKMSDQPTYFNIHFLRDSPTKKTQVFKVTSKDESTILGQIQWHGAWRKYVFAPNQNTIYDNKCMIELARICEEKTKEQLKRK